MLQAKTFPPVVLLGLDTCTGDQSLALARSGSVLAERRLEAAGRHSETLLPALTLLLDEAGMTPADLSAIAVTAGPGTFTGLRVGLATAKGLALASAIPLAGFSTLRVLAEALAEESRAPGGTLICALLEAGRGQVYRGLYRVEGSRGGGWQTARQGEEGIVDPRMALLGLPEGSVAGGEGLERVRRLGSGGDPEGLRLVEAPPLAPLLAARASEMLADGSLPRGPLIPNYLRPPEAWVAKP